MLLSSEVYPNTLATTLRTNATQQLQEHEDIRKGKEQTMTDKRKEEIWQQLRERVKQLNQRKRQPHPQQVAAMKQQLAQTPEPALETQTHAQTRPTARS